MHNVVNKLSTALACCSLLLQSCGHAKQRNHGDLEASAARTPCSGKEFDAAEGYKVQFLRKPDDGVPQQAMVRQVFGGSQVWQLPVHFAPGSESSLTGRMDNVVCRINNSLKIFWRDPKKTRGVVYVGTGLQGGEGDKEMEVIPSALCSMKADRWAIGKIFMYPSLNGIIDERVFRAEREGFVDSPLVFSDMEELNPSIDEIDGADGAVLDPITHKKFCKRAGVRNLGPGHVAIQGYRISKRKKLIIRGVSVLVRFCEIDVEESFDVYVKKNFYFVSCNFISKKPTVHRVKKKNAEEAKRNAEEARKAAEEREKKTLKAAEEREKKLQKEAKEREERIRKEAEEREERIRKEAEKARKEAEEREERIRKEAEEREERMREEAKEREERIRKIEEEREEERKRSPSPEELKKLKEDCERAEADRKKAEQKAEADRQKMQEKMERMQKMVEMLLRKKEVDLSEWEVLGEKKPVDPVKS